MWRTKFWNNKFYYKPASGLYFYWAIYDARIHEYLSLTSALCGGGRLCNVSAALRTEMTRCPLYSRLGGPQDRSGLVHKIWNRPEIDPPTIQPVSSRFSGLRYQGLRLGASLMFILRPYATCKCTSGQTEKFLNVKMDGTYCEHCTLTFKNRASYI
jgi:hypothetical protein